jgi:uncharacterized protein
MQAFILEKLDAIEAEHGVRILYACESGSRGWGFASKDSDYDVRFIYCHPRDWYLTIGEPRDVIELPINDVLDINGWDLRKALQLMSKSNPTLLEWLSSPIVYREDAGTIAPFRALAEQSYVPQACLHHYLQMARGNFRDYLKADEIWVKKYFCVLRPVLACLWIEAGYGVVPMRFDALVQRMVTDPHLQSAIEALKRRKMAGDELDRGPRNEVISAFLERELERLNSAQRPMPNAKPTLDEADALFRSVLR